MSLKKWRSLVNKETHSFYTCHKNTQPQKKRETLNPGVIAPFVANMSNWDPLGKKIPWNNRRIKGT